MNDFLKTFPRVKFVKTHFVALAVILQTTGSFTVATFRVSTVTQSHQTFANFRSKRLRISIETRFNGVLSILLMTDVVVTTYTIAIITKFPICEAFTVPERRAEDAISAS